MISFGNFCYDFFKFSTETLEQNIRKSHTNMFFQMEKKTRVCMQKSNENSSKSYYFRENAKK